MEILYVTGEEMPALPQCVATVGFFDGVHVGHRHVIAQVRDIAATNGLLTCVVTFDRHPRQVVNPDFSPQLLTTLDEKLQILESLHVDVCAVLPFDKQMAAMDAATFMKRILADRLNVRHLVIGYDNRFGHGRTDNFAQYVAYGQHMGMEVTASDEEQIEGLKVSSSRIRKSLEEGNVERAAASLGYPYSLSGVVVDGFRQGRKMGFPTANIRLADNGKLIPAPGAYAVMAWMENQTAPRKAMMNIGTRPTFHGHTLTLEVHVLDFSDNLYGQVLRVDFMHRIREERPFADVAALTAQLHRDRENAEKWFKDNKI